MNIVTANNLGNGTQVDSTNSKIHFGFYSPGAVLTAWPTSVPPGVNLVRVNISTAAGNFNIHSQLIPAGITAGTVVRVRKTNATNRITLTEGGINSSTNVATGSYMTVVYDGAGGWIMIGEG